MCCGLSGNALDRYRETAARYLLQSAQVQRAVKPGNGMGGRRQEWAIVGTYRARLQTRQTEAKESVQAGGVQAVAPYDVLLPYTADVKPADRIYIDGQVYEVVGGDPGTGSNLYLTVNVKRIEAS